MNAIVAVSKNWGIGKDGKLLFDIPEDMKFFKETTTGCTVIMGRKTLESFPGGRPLKGRRNIVLSGRADHSVPGAETVSGVVEALEAISGEDPERVFVIGGAKVYEELLPFCKKAYVTFVDEESEPDRFFPNLDSDSRWELVSVDGETESNGKKIRFALYRNQDCQGAENVTDR